MVIVLATLWRDRVDSWAGWFSGWAEDVMLGKKGILDTFTGYLARRAESSQGNGHAVIGEVKEKVAV